MAKRSETAERKIALMGDLRAAYHHSGPASEPMALSQRELCARYGLSAPVISRILQQLVQEGVLYTVPRVGTFMGRPPAEATGLYVLLSSASRKRHIMLDQIQTGFEERIAQLGGTSDAFTVEDAVSHSQHGELPVIAGQFLFDAFLSGDEQANLLQDVHKVVYAGSAGSKALTSSADSVDFDNEFGGAQAAQHLLQVGHRNIAFLGLHATNQNATNQNATNQNGDAFSWSRQRANGWLKMMESTGHSTHALDFHPQTSLSFEAGTQTASALESAKELLRNSKITAVIAVNVYALHGLLEALQEMKMAVECWPAIVCFDETPRSRAAGVSYLRLPWEKLGSEAAQLLWDRRNGHVTGAPQQRLVKMHLIPRSTCRPDWAQASSFTQRRVVELATFNSLRQKEQREVLAA